MKKALESLIRQGDYVTLRENLSDEKIANLSSSDMGDLLQKALEVGNWPIIVLIHHRMQDCPRLLECLDVIKHENKRVTVKRIKALECSEPESTGKDDTTSQAEQLHRRNVFRMFVDEILTEPITAPNPAEPITTPNPAEPITTPSEPTPCKEQTHTSIGEARTWIINSALRRHREMICAALRGKPSGAPRPATEKPRTGVGDA